MDRAKIYGACFNRVDHTLPCVLTNNVEYVIFLLRSFDIEDFGVLSPNVNIKSVEADGDKKSGIFMSLGSFDYRKPGLILRGGNDVLDCLLSFSGAHGAT